jgi:hypothetical protein
MAVLQSIDDAREERIGRDGVTAAAYADALAHSADALAWIRARHADGKLPLLRLPEKTDDLAGISGAAERLLAGAADIVFLGTGGSSLGGQTVAQLAGCRGSALCATARACTSWTISIPTPMRRCWHGCRSPRRASSRYRNPAAPARR